jgi:hypothetical protein
LHNTIEIIEAVLEERKQKTLAYIRNLPKGVRDFVTANAELSESEIPAKIDEKPGNRAQKRRIEHAKKVQKSRKTVAAKERLARRRQKALRRECRWHAQIIDRYPLAGVKPRFIPLALWRRAWAIVADPTGRAAEYSLAAFGNHAAAKAIRDAATAYGVRSMARPRARLIVALGLTIAALASAKSDDERYPRELRGIPQAAFRALLRDPFTGVWPSLTAIIGIHTEDGSVENSELGYLRALEETGFCRTIRLPKYEVTKREALGVHALARYQVIGREYQPLISTVDVDESAKNWLKTRAVYDPSHEIAAIGDIIDLPESPPD